MRAIEAGCRYSFTTFEEYVGERWDMEVRRANQVIEVAFAAEQIGKIFPTLPSKESHVRELLKLVFRLGRSTVRADGLSITKRWRIDIFAHPN